MRVTSVKVMRCFLGDINKIFRCWLQHYGSSKYKKHTERVLDLVNPYPANVENMVSCYQC